MNITEEKIESMAPNSSAVTNARKISKTGGFNKLCRSDDNTLLFGECKGSGSKPYMTSVDFIDETNPVFRCSCPSRQIPCKHGLAILFDYVAGKTFTVSDIPEDITQKREKKVDAAKKKEKKATSGTSKTAAVKKLKKQLEGFDLVDRFINDTINHGIAALVGTPSYTLYDIAKQLGDYYLIEPQGLIMDILFNIRYMKINSEKACENILKCIVKLRSISRKGREFLNEKIEKGEMPAEDNTLLESIGFIWQLSQLKEIGLSKKNAELIQLSFDVIDDRARCRSVDIGWWMDLQTGEISKTENSRPDSAAGHIKADNTKFGVYMIPELCMYPGEINRRIRWDTNYDLRTETDEDYQKMKSFAITDAAALVKYVKNYIKNPLSGDSLVALIKCDSFVFSPENECHYVLLGNQYFKCDEVSDEKKKYLESAEYITAQIYIENSKINIKPLSLLFDDGILRLVY